jgi:polyisoprenoid-binding protein YceI
MRVTAGWKLLPLLCALALAGCAGQRQHRAAPQPAPVAPQLGRPYQLSGAQSLLTVLVFRGGLLASSGHNHVIASHTLSGAIYLSDDLARTSFELQLPVGSLTVDEPQLRAQLASSDFPPDVPDSAREGTRANMLGPALLDAAHYPQITLRALSLQLRGGDRSAGDALAHVQAQVRGQLHSFDVPVHYQLQGDLLQVGGSCALRQSELGLTPISALLGALQVQDQMQLSFQLVAHAVPAGPGAR